MHWIGCRKIARKVRIIIVNPSAYRAQLDSEWSDSIKMALIARDLMVGNPRLEKLGHGEQSLGHNAIAAGFKAAAWTDYSKWRFHGGCFK